MRPKISKTLILLTIVFSLSFPPLLLCDQHIPNHTIRLLTVAPTHHFFQWFGHVGIEVEYNRLGYSKVYNFGGFSFQPEDLSQFLLGKFTFWSFTEDKTAMLKRYMEAERHIVIQTLDLTPDQKKRIISALRFATKPENQDYQYDHFRENCATRIRDILNLALENQIYSHTRKIQDQTYRSHINRLTYDQPALNFILNTILSNGVDAPISEWEAMFLPDRLMTILPTLENTGHESLAINRMDLSNNSPSPFFSGVVSPPNWKNQERLIGWGMAAWLIAAYLLYRIKIPLVRKLYPISLSAYGLSIGFIGLSLFFMSVIASHVDTYWNENLFLTNPVTFLLFPLGLILMFEKGKQITGLITLLCGVAGLAGYLLKVLPHFQQVNDQQLRVMFPVTVTIGLTGFITLVTSHKHVQR